MKRILIILCFTLLCSICRAQTPPTTLKFSHLSLKAKADLGEVTFTYHLTPENGNANVGMQIFAHREDVTKREQWDLINPINADSTAIILNLYKGLDNTGSFTLPLPKGTYGAFRLLLFHSPDAKAVDYTRTLYDSNADKAHSQMALNVKVTTTERRVTSPVLAFSTHPAIRSLGDGNFSVAIHAVVKVPQGYTAPDNGLWAMAKGDVGFSQVWANLAAARPANDPLDNYNSIPIDFEINNARPGIWNIQFGLFPQGFGHTLYWSYPGLDIEVGGEAWVSKAPESSIPPRLRVRQGQFETLFRKPHDFYADNPAGKKAVGFVRGGNFGNAINWTLKPELNAPGYFVLLKSMGCKYMRFAFNPDRYVAESIYQHAVDQIVQNIWAAGLYPLITPQDLPQGDTLDERIEKGLKVVQAMAQRYEGKSVWIEVCNEPHEFATWAEWKPTASRYAKAIRAIDPEAFVVVPFENWSKDGRAAAKDPITDVAVDLYDAHAYVEPGEVAPLFGPAIKAGLPVLIGEYGGGDKYLAQMDLALQKLSPAPLACGPWAFTVKGQDNLPLVLDGSTAELRMTPSGQVIQADYAAWDAGHKRGEGN